MNSSIRLIEHESDFVAGWDRLFKFCVRWFCLYFALVFICYEAYYWLRFAEFLDLETFKIVPPRLLGFLYNLTTWEGVNILIYNFLRLPIFVTVPLVNLIFLSAFFQTVLAMYFLTGDVRAFLKKSGNILKKK